MNIIAIDPGPDESALLVMNRQSEIIQAELLSNQEVLQFLRYHDLPAWVAFEWISSYGMAVGQSIFETCRWAGRFEEAWNRSTDHYKAYPILRRDVKSHLCGNVRADDRFVREALIDRWGGKEKAIGLKKTPGPLYHIKDHLWAALAVAIYVADVIAPKE